MSLSVDRSLSSGPDLAAALAGTGHAVYEWDIAADTLIWSDSVAAVLGVSASQVATGRAFASLLDSRNTTCPSDAVLHAAEPDHGGGVPYAIEYGLRPGGASGPLLWVEDSGRWFADAAGRPARALGVVRTANERHARDMDLVFRSGFDPLTGGMNRMRLAEVLDAALVDAHKVNGSVGFLLAAIDNLAVINAAYGFATADDIIAAVAQRLRARLRAGDSLGRFSGNKFGIVLLKCSGEDLDVAAARLCDSMRGDMIRCAAGPVSVTLSLGGVLVPRHARTSQEAFVRAQEALDTAKLHRRGSFVAYAPSLERDMQRRENARMTDEIVGALNQQRVSLAYQRIVDATSEAVVFHEALMRVRTADGQPLAGGVVVPLAERLGLVRLIDHRVLNLVLQALSQDPQLHLSVNVSPSSILDREWSDLLRAGLRHAGELAERLIVEITESAAIRDVDATRGFVRRVKDLGARVAIDDFGAGYTSFRNLRDLEVDLVKIDGSFVARMSASPDDHAFVRTLIDLSRQLGLEIVAEWVQDEATADMLRLLGCNYLQGSLFGMADVTPASVARA